VPIEIPVVLERLCYRYPSFLVDAIVEHEPGRRIVAVKNVTVNEEFFQGHFPGAPLMPGVLMIEALAQVASVLVLQENGGAEARAFLRGVNNAKFRRAVVPGDRLRLEVRMGRRHPRLVRMAAAAFVGEHMVAEAELLLGTVGMRADIHPTASVHRNAVVGADSSIGPNAIVGEHVKIGRRCHIGASAVIDGWTEIGDDNEIFPFASIGLIPQDKKFRGEKTRLVIGNSNVFREFVTINRGTAGGGGLTQIGDDNLFMAYAHVAHDCRVGSHTVFANGATLAGHVLVDDYATIGAFSGVHQFCRVGRDGYIGGYSVVTKDALPFGKTVGNRARIYGLNTIGLMRRGFTSDTITKLKRAYRYLLQSKLNTTRALAQIDDDPSLACREVAYLVDFIRSSRRGVILRRATRRMEEMVEE
jgi:UDP-N-acetylglucosamine acyltransferase